MRQRTELGLAHAGVQVREVLGSRNSVSYATEVDNKQREGVKNDNDVLHFRGLEGVNRKVGIRDGKGHNGGRDEPGCPFSGRWEKDPGRQ